jgi:hypothetical protein
MELKVDIMYEQLLKLIKQLPAGKIAQLKSELNDTYIKKKAKTEISDFQEFLLKGPVMSDNQYSQFLENRKRFNEWRVK